MANSKFEYVKGFEEQTMCLKETYMVVRIDGRAFTKMCAIHEFEKPNDKNALNLMNKAAMVVMDKFEDIFLGYGQSDEYSFVFKKSSDVFERRIVKITTCMASLFTAGYIMNFEDIMGYPLKTIPSFDARVICYPSEKILIDYFSWRQADCHINNLYNTIFWKLVQSGETERRAEEILSGTLSSEKNEMLFTRFGINYSKEDLMFKKGSVLVWDNYIDPEKQAKFEEFVAANPDKKMKPPKMKRKLAVHYDDIINKSFWIERFGEEFK